MTKTNETGWAIVTGASSGIGLEIARELLARGQRVIVVARRRERLEELAKQNGGRVEIVTADLGTDEGVNAVVARASELGDVDLLVNNAGVGMVGAFADASLDRIRAMLKLNIDALVLLTHRLLPGMIARKRGAVINVASTAAFQPMAFFGAYSASKSFVVMFTEALSEELRGTGVRALAVCPGAVRTEFTDIAQAAALSEKLPSLDASTVAKAALHALDRGRVVKIVGLLNFILVESVRLLPRAFMRWMMGKMARPAPALSSGTAGHASP